MHDPGKVPETLVVDPGEIDEAVDRAVAAYVDPGTYTVTDDPIRRPNRRERRRRAALARKRGAR